MSLIIYISVDASWYFDAFYCAFFFQGSGSIEFSEFLSAFSATFEPPSSDELIKSFKQFDENGDGVLTHDEIKKVMKATGQPCTDKAVREMIKAADKDNDGKVNYEGKTLSWQNRSEFQKYTGWCFLLGYSKSLQTIPLLL